MLKKEAWTYYPQDIMVEYRQCMEEGKDVSAYEPLCRALFDLSKEVETDLEGQGLWKKLMEAPLAEGFSYREPSLYEEILKELPGKRHTFKKPAADAALEDKIFGAWSGRLSGCLLGKPVEGWKREPLKKLLKGTGNFPMKGYITKESFSEALIKELEINPEACWADTIGEASPIDDDTNYTVLALKLLEDYGRDFTPADVANAWLRWLPYLDTCTAERVAYRNSVAGLLPPETASYQNPYREWIGAQIRGDFFGYINPGDPKAAAEMAWRDASISHVKNGIYGEMFIAAMIAAAAVTDDLRVIVEAGLDEIPQNCRLREAVDEVIAWVDEGLDGEAVCDKIHEKFDEYDAHDWCHTISNAMIVTASLLLGEGDFGRSICMAVEMAFDTDCNGATVGSIIGMRNGKRGIDPYWTEMFNEKLYTSIKDNNLVTIGDLTRRTISLMGEGK